MLKWIAAPKGNHPPSAPRSNKTSNTIDNSPLAWLTDDPLATLNVNTIHSDTKRTWKSAALRRQSQPEQIYSVTRMNPLFVDSPKDVMVTKLSEGEKRLMDDSRSSNRSEQCQTPSSSGYESAADADKRRPNSTNAPHHKHQANQSAGPQGQQVDNHRRHYQQQQHLIESSPASDYRRQFVLGPRMDRSPPLKKAADVAGLIPRRIGKANLLHQDSLYVTRIHMPSVANKPAGTGTDGASKPIAVVDEWDANDAPNHPSTHRTIPHPVWPSKSAAGRQGRVCKAASSAIVQQNENYVTKIVIAPQTDDLNSAGRVASADDGDRGLDSIVTHSLLVMTSYDGQSTDDSASDSARANRQPSNKEELGRVQRMTPAELSEIRQLSQTISQSRPVATVSRAFSKNSDASTSSSGSTPEVYTSYPASPSSKNEDDSATIGSSIARRISMMKERWDKTSRRQLLTESDDDDPASFFNRRLDQLYVPENGDVNFSVGHKHQMTINDRRIHGGDAAASSSSPFSYLAGMYHPTTITEEATTNDNEVLVAVTPNRMCMPSHQTSYGDPFEHDRLSNSSSRSSGSRRVTFSADTVDNEQSTKSSISTASGNSISVGSTSASDHHKTSNHHCPDIIEELKLNPHYLPHRYQQQPDGRSARLAGYYSYNLQAQLDNYNRNLDVGSAKDGAAKVSTWEHYHQQEAPSKASSSSTGRPSAAIRLDPYNNLQLHPNYGAACQQERSMCVDFTLDGVEEALLQRRSDSHKLRRRLCCCLLLLLCLVVLVIVVIVISLYLSQGQMIFGSLGPV
ncbi:hypothetical protein GHT06_007716 [Daphnia sinensis]|uniref:Uncharacterized protein n=1 Tax=Daphnia sinensis TaxID=1820382 RepID=A0AAD5LKG0_9CRUS|nr:hypothetical protein GHT06_007716 [Daphnia sinensis]